MNIILPLLFITCFAASCSLGQTGPAGVGTPTTNVLWLKADAGTSTVTNGSAISSWEDQSGNNVVLTQSTAVQQPLFVSSLMNGYPSVEFDNTNGAGQNDYLTAPDNPIFDNTSGYSFFTVTRMKSLSNAQSIISKRNNVGNQEAFMIFFYTGNALHVDIDNDNNRFSNGVANTINTNRIYDVFYDGNLSAGQRTTIFDREQLQITSTESSATVADKNSPLIVGATHLNDPRAFDGYISEIIVYRTKVNDAQRIIINNHLSSKYDIALNSNDFYLGDNALNGHYDRDVAGIGQDATGSSNPQFNPSTCAGLGIQTVSGLDNGDYILAGHAFPTNSEITTDVAGITGTNVSRWQRIWYIDITNTGTSNTTVVTFDMSDGNMTGVNLGIVTNYILAYRATQTGPWTEIATASSIVGDQILFSNQMLTLDGYYTLATKDYSASPLPVELTFFDAQLIDSKVEITWQTANEHNSSHFSVERSENGEQWASVGTVSAQGNSSVNVDYSFTDEMPLPGISYYRLKQIDLDGDFDYSNIKVIDNSRVKNQVQLFPNPVNNGLLNILSEETISTVKLVDSKGKLLFEENPYNEHSYTLDLKPFSSGTYFVLVNEEYHQVIIL